MWHYRLRIIMWSILVERSLRDVVVVVRLGNMGGGASKKQKRIKGPLFNAALKGDVEASIAVIRPTGYLQAKPALSRTHPQTISHTHSHSLTHTNTHTRRTHSHTHTLTTCHSPTHTFTLLLTLTHSHTHTPQQVRSLLASGIKPDAERDQVSLFWCRLD